MVLPGKATSELVQDTSYNCKQNLENHEELEKAAVLHQNCKTKMEWEKKEKNPLLVESTVSQLKWLQTNMDLRYCIMNHYSCLHRWALSD